MVVMRDEFLTKLNSNEYISKRLYDNVLKTSPSILPQSFNIEEYNSKIINEKYNKYRNYFNSMYAGVDDNIKLDEEQIKAILAEEDFSLIIAGAGTGKTTTMVSKVKYLVDIKHVDPSSIIVLSYTKKACEELEKRLLIDFKLPVKVATFHSLGLLYIREIFRHRKCFVVDQNLRDELFYQYFTEEIFPHKDKIKELLDNFNTLKGTKLFLFGNHFKKNYDKYKTFDEYFEAYKEMKKNTTDNLKEVVDFKIDQLLNREDPVTIQNELVKSKGEALIANFLYCNNIEYKYEKIYKELMPDKSTYRPDFTLDLLGEEVYIEYFGLSNYNGKFSRRYEEIRKMKESYHKKNNNKFIKVDYKVGEDLYKELETNLLKLGFRLIPRSTEEIYERLLDNNKISQIFGFKELLYTIIDTIKSSPKRKDYFQIVKKYINCLPEGEQQEALIQFKYFNNFYKYYQKKLYGSENYGFDFSDMIYYANMYLDRVSRKKYLYKYLIIDEYQDISNERYRFTRHLAKRNNAKVIAVGDDWQSIFAFAGSNINYTYNFEKFFEGAKLLKITKTYRNSQALIDYSGTFIMKNEKQIKKDLVSSKCIPNPIKFVFFEEGEEYKRLKELILHINKKKPTHSIMILSRNNHAISECYKEPELKDGISTKIEFVGHDEIDINGMTIHKSKGLASDEVILLGLDQNFPNKNNTEYWLKSLFKPEIIEESYPYAEERRLFYVALTRTKNYVYLLVNKNEKLRSPFINEIYSTIKNCESKKENKDTIKKIS